MATDSTPAWTIEGQVEDYRQLPSGQFGQGIVVSFRTAEGATGTVFVPLDKYTADEVRAAVSARAATMAAVAKLSG